MIGEMVQIMVMVVGLVTTYTVGARFLSAAVTEPGPKLSRAESAEIHRRRVERQRAAVIKALERETHVGEFRAGDPLSQKSVKSTDP